MPWLWNAVILLFAYLLGSVPNAVWIGKVFFNTDVREHGSKNAGSTNTIRVLGYKAGIPVLLLDILKGFLAVKMIYFTFYYIPATGEYINFQLLLGLAVITGHIFPVFANFRGGKGVATLIGVIMAIDPLSTLICIGVFMATLLTTKYVSLSSMIAGLSFPVLVIVVFNTTTSSLVIFSLIVFVLLLFTHQKNIERLVRNEESKANFLFRKRDDL
ncbi:MAG: glycerol-3-phosphate 1-O-acyltransferase PlsY [Bacteroidales bacterium]